MRLMSSGNNVKPCDTSCKSAIKMPSLLLCMYFDEFENRYLVGWKTS